MCKSIVFYSDCVCIPHHSEIKRYHILAEDCDLLIVACIRRPGQLGGSCRNIATTFGVDKLDWTGVATLLLKKFDDMFSRFDGV